MASRVGHKSNIFRVPDDETLAMNPAHHIELFLNCTQLITNYTRSNLSSMSTIDHIYTSMPEYMSVHICLFGRYTMLIK